MSPLPPITTIFMSFSCSSVPGTPCLRLSPVAMHLGRRSRLSLDEPGGHLDARRIRLEDGQVAATSFAGFSVAHGGNHTRECEHSGNSDHRYLFWISR